MTEGAPMGPYEGFEGTVKRLFTESKPWWPRTPSAPEGAPNVVIMLMDDLGFSDLGCFGSEIETPFIDALAWSGTRYANFHVTPLCSPSRAALLTGMNPHAAGMGFMALGDTGFPGYRGQIAPNVVTAAETFREGGYHTLFVGKWHLTPDVERNVAARRESWPVYRGFERSYGFLDEGCTNFHQPHALYEDGHPLEVDQYPSGYYFTDDITDKAISWIRESKAANPSKPFFLYFAHAAMHAPLQAKASDIEKYRGRYDVGWDEIRRRRFDRQLEMGIVPDNAELPPPNRETDYEVEAWDELSDDERRIFARYMEVYAAMLDNVDQNLGRLCRALDDLGQLDNTVIIFTSDNGASKEGGPKGTTEYFRSLSVQPYGSFDTFERDLSRIDLIGSPQVLAQYPRGWAMASNTPFRLFKFTQFNGGQQAPMIISWPREIEPGGLRSQYVFISDVLPTLMEICGLDPIQSRNGVATKPMSGQSFWPTIRDTGVETRSEQFFETGGHRAFYRDGWEIVTLHYREQPLDDREWQLFHVTEDPTQLINLAEAEREKLQELSAAWEEAAWVNEALPLDDGLGFPVARAPGYDDVFTQPVTILPNTPTLERWRSAVMVHNRSFVINADMVQGDGDEGVLVSHGDQGGGYLLYVENGELFYLHNGYGNETLVDCGPLEPGTHEVVAAFTARAGRVWDVDVRVDGHERQHQRDLAMLVVIAPFEGITVGRDPRSPVSWELNQRHGSFPYSGDLKAVRYEAGEFAPDAHQPYIESLVKSMLQFE